MTPQQQPRVLDIHQLSQQHRNRVSWTELVGSRVVAVAWEKLCNSIVQEVSSQGAPLLILPWQLLKGLMCHSLVKGMAGVYV